MLVVTRLFSRDALIIAFVLLSLSALAPQTFLFWGRGDDWVGLFLLDGLPSFETRLHFMLNAPWIGGRPVAAVLSSAIYSVLNPDYSNLWLFRAFNLFLGATWVAVTYSICRRLGLGKSLAAPISLVPLTLPGMNFWLSSLGSFVYLLGALVAQIAGLLLIAPKRWGIFAAFSGALFSVFCYQPTLALVLLAPSIYALTTRSAQDRWRVLWSASLTYLLALGINFFVVLLTGGNYRLVRPTAIEMLRIFVVELLPRSILPWLQVFNINQYLLSGLAITFLVVGFKLWKSKLRGNDHEQLFEATSRNTWDRLLELTTPIWALLITVCPLVFVNSIEGTRVTTFSSVVYWSIILVLLKRLNLSTSDQKSVRFSTNGWGLSLLTATAAILSAGLYFSTTVRPAIQEWACMREASQVAKYPPSLPIGLGVKSPSWIRETDEMGESSLALENPTRFQILYSFQDIRKDPQLDIFIWDVPVNRQASSDSWTKTFLSCIQLREQP